MRELRLSGRRSRLAITAAPAIGGVLAVAIAAAQGAPQVPPPVAQALAAAGLPSAALSFTVVDAASGAPLAGLDADLPRSPASTFKVVTTFAALDLLGPAHTWQTRALADGTVAGGVLDGDLILQGGGDPYLTLERWWDFVRRLRATGLRSIHGDIVVDESAYTLPPEDPAAFDARPHRTYNATPAALQVNFQAIEFRIAPLAAAHRIEIRAEPALPNLRIVNHVEFVPGACDRVSGRVAMAVAQPAGERVVFSGRLAAGCRPRQFTRVLLQPATYAYGSFVALWRAQGGEFTGRLRRAPAPPDAQELLSYESLSLGEVVRLTNKHSNNLLARHLLYSMGEARYGSPATEAKGRAALAEWSAHRGRPLPEADIGNGAGLSRELRVSAAWMAALLCDAWRSPYAPEFLASLPLAGLDGTLRTRMLGAPPGTVRLKTGHIDGVSGVAGYVTTADGRSLVVVSLVNDARADGGAAEPVHAALLRWVREAL